MYDPFWSFDSTISNSFAGVEASQANSRATSAEQHVKELESRVEKLALACNAMWNLLQSQTGLTDQQLQDKITEMNAADGVGDPRLPRKLIECANCHRRVSPRRGKCMYCGNECTGGSAFGAT